MKPVSSLFPRLLPLVPGCPEPLAQQALVDAAIAFCEDSQAIRSDLDTLYVVAGVSEYELEPPTSQSVTTVLDVTIDGARLKSLYFDESAGLPATTGKPTHFYTTRNTGNLVLHFFPAPDARYKANVTVATRPTRTSTTLEEDLTDLWADAVVSGAVARIASIPGQPFTSIEMASAMGSMSVAASRNARRSASSGQIRGSMAVKGRPFA